MNKPVLAGEPSMDEILASIRKIIAEDPGAAAKRPLPETKARLPVSPMAAEPPMPPQAIPSPVMPSLSSLDRSSPVNASRTVEPAAPPQSPAAAARRSSIFGTLAEALNAPVPQAAKPPTPVAPLPSPAAALDDDLADLLDEQPSEPALPPLPAAPPAAARIDAPAPALAEKPIPDPFDGLTSWRSTPAGGAPRTPLGGRDTAPPGPPPVATTPPAGDLGAFVPASPVIDPVAAGMSGLPLQIPGAPHADKLDNPFGFVPRAPAEPVLEADLPELPDEPSSGPVVIAAMPPAEKQATVPVLPAASGAGELKNALDALMARSAALQPLPAAPAETTLSEPKLPEPEPEPEREAPPPQAAVSPVLPAAPKAAAPPVASPAFAELLANEPPAPTPASLDQPAGEVAARMMGLSRTRPRIREFGLFDKPEAEAKATADVVPVAPMAPSPAAPDLPPSAAAAAAAPEPAVVAEPPTPLAAVSALDALAQGLAASGAAAAPASLPALARSVFAEPDFFIHGMTGKPAPEAAQPASTVPPPLPHQPPTIAAELVPNTGPRTMDETVADLLRPMLKQWLSDNMPRIVEQALRIELAQGLEQQGLDKPKAK